MFFENTLKQIVATLTAVVGAVSLPEALTQESVLNLNGKPIAQIGLVVEAARSAMGMQRINGGGQDAQNHKFARIEFGLTRKAS